MAKRNKNKRNNRSTSVKSINLGEIPAQQIHKLRTNRLNAIATNPNLKEHTKLDSYQIIFTSYNTSTCELAKLDKQLSRKLIERLQEITKLDHTTLHNWSRSRVNDSGKYSNLYKSLSEDIQLYEKEFSATARIFFYTVGNYFCIVSINTKHIDY